MGILTMACLLSQYSLFLRRTPWYVNAAKVDTLFKPDRQADKELPAEHLNRCM